MRLYTNSPDPLQKALPPIISMGTINEYSVTPTIIGPAAFYIGACTARSTGTRLLFPVSILPISAPIGLIMKISRRTLTRGETCPHFQSHNSEPIRLQRAAMGTMT